MIARTFILYLLQTTDQVTITPLFYRLGNGGWVQRNNNSGYGPAQPARTLVRQGAALAAKARQDAGGSKRNDCLLFEFG